MVIISQKKTFSIIQWMLYIYCCFSFSLLPSLVCHVSGVISQPKHSHFLILAKLFWIENCFDLNELFFLTCFLELNEENCICTKVLKSATYFLPPASFSITLYTILCLEYCHTQWIYICRLQLLALLLICLSGFSSGSGKRVASFWPQVWWEGRPRPKLYRYQPGQPHLSSVLGLCLPANPTESCWVSV